MLADKIFKLRMYAEVRYTYKNSVDYMGELKELTKDLYDIEAINPDEFLLKRKDKMAEDWEIRIKPNRLTFTMDSCPSYEYFVEMLQSNLNVISKVITPQEVLGIGVQGYYLYSINSIEDFSQVVTSWSQNYADKDPDSVGISDIGVSVFLKEDKLNICIMCSFLSQEQATRLFPKEDRGLISELNLFIDVNISTGDLNELKKAFSPTLVLAIKAHINQATRKLEEKLESVLKNTV